MRMRRIASNQSRLRAWVTRAKKKSMIQEKARKRREIARRMQCTRLNAQQMVQDTLNRAAVEFVGNQQISRCICRTGVKEASSNNNGMTKLGNAIRDINAALNFRLTLRVNSGAIPGSSTAAGRKQTAKERCHRYPVK